MSENEEVRKLEARARGMLPGVAGISLFMLVLTLVNAFAALNGKFGSGGGKYGVLALCTLLAAGVFGLLRLRRWGWALTLGAVLFSATYGMWAVVKGHQVGLVLMVAINLILFLYLVRPEVRERLK